MTAAKFRVGNEKMRSKVDGMTVFNTTQLDSTKQKMFFGPPLGVQRYDKFKYPVFDKLTQQQLGYFWRPEEVSLQKDRADYQTLNACLLYTSPSPRDATLSRMPSSA